MKEGSVVKHIVQRTKAARRGHPTLVQGSILWLIVYPGGRFYHYGYVLKSTAEKVKERLVGDLKEIEWNSTNDPENVLQSWSELP